jgi:hypothetical protein
MKQKQTQTKLTPTHFKRHSIDQSGTSLIILIPKKLNTNTKVYLSNGLQNKSVMIMIAMPKDQTVLSLSLIVMKMLNHKILRKLIRKDVILFTPRLMLLDAWLMMPTLLWPHMLNSLVPL